MEPLHFLNLICYSPENEGGSNGGDNGDSAGDSASDGANDNTGSDDVGAGDSGASDPKGRKSLFKATEGGSKGDESSSKWDGPDFIAEKFRGAENPLEAQAKSYHEAIKRLSTKTDALKEEIREETMEEVKAELLKERGAVESPESFEYPEGWEAPAEAVDAEFRSWAHEAGLSQDQFSKLVEMYGQTLPDLAAEKEKLGGNADQRLGLINAWATSNIPKALHEAVADVMTTAEGCELLEHLMQRGGENNFLPGEGDPPSRQTKADLIAMQNDERYWHPTKKDPAYQKQVDEAWQRWAAAGGDR